MFYPYFDSTYILVLIGMAIVMFAQTRVQNTFRKFSQWQIQSQITGKEAAERLLHARGINNVQVEPIAGQLTDHYDPKAKVLRLSEATYGHDSISAVAVAAHECGHALQDAENYPFLRLRSSLVPIVNIGSSIAIPMIIIGMLLSVTGLINLGIIAFALTLLFQLVTLPVEFDASKRALAILESQHIFTTEEIPAARKVLNAAAFTYIAATLSTALQLLRFIGLSNRRRH